MRKTLALEALRLIAWPASSCQAPRRTAGGTAAGRASATDGSEEEVQTADMVDSWEGFESAQMARFGNE
jgi:hypothetical protein